MVTKSNLSAIDKLMLPLVVGIEGTELSSEETALFQRVRPAGYILFSRNVETLEQVRYLTDRLRRISQEFHPIICIDQEGGRVSRTQKLLVSTPSAERLSRYGSSEHIAEAAHLTLAALRMLGVTMNLAPVLDLEQGQSNALPSRCWGKDPDEIIRKAGIYNRVINDAGMASCLKHFPGMGKAMADPHLALPVVSSSWDELCADDLRPFSALLPESPAVMIAHVLFPLIDSQNPSSLSPALVGDILRKRLAYDGLVLTDDLCMGAITELFPPEKACVAALRAGCDLPLLCHDVMHHLPEAVREIENMETSETADTLRRLQRFLKGATPCPPLSSKSWEDLICRSIKLEKDVPNLLRSVPASKVQNY